MKISCPNCSAAYELDDARVPPSGLNIKCPKCKNPFTVHRPKGDAAKPPAKAGKSAPPGGKAPPPKMAPIQPPAKPKPGGAVPLPGMADGPAAASSAFSDLDPPAAPSAVALPGLDGGQGPQRTAVDFRPPTGPTARKDEADGVVPLPGFEDQFGSPGAPPGDDPFGSVDFEADKPAAPAAKPPPPPPPDDDDPFPIDAVAPPPAPKEEPMSFDFAEPKLSQISAAPSAAGSPEMLDFVDDAPKGPGAKKPPPPVIAKEKEKGKGKKEETLPFDEPPPEASVPSSVSRLEEKERKKKERDERAARDRRERARRKAEQGTGKIKRAARQLTRPRHAIAVALLVGLAAAGVLGYRARRTSAGLFWTNQFLTAKKAASAAEAKVVEQGLQKLNRGDFTSAREALAAAAQLIETVPDDEEVRAFFVLTASELKIEYGQVGSDWDQARRVIEKMKANRPSQNRARGAFSLASGEVTKAKQYLATLGDTPNADLDSTWLYAMALVSASESARAAQVLDNALRSRGTSTRLLLLRGAVARESGQLPEAGDFFQRALKSSPENARALVELASVRLRQNDQKAVTDLLTKALDTDIRKTMDAGEEARANMLRGTLAMQQRDLRAAEAAYERAVALDPNSPRVHEAYGEFRLQRLEWDKAARQFEAAIKFAGSAGAYAGAARAYLGQNRLLEADKAINEAVAKDANNARYLYLQGRVADAIGKAEEAYRKYEAALKAKPDLVEALCAEGLVWISRADTAKGQERFETALKVPVEGLTAVEDEAIGELALALGHTEKAKEAYARAMQKDPDDPIGHAGMGKALAAKGNLASARKEMEIALAQLDSDASLAYEYGSLLRRMGESHSALESFRKAVKLDSKETKYRARLGGLLVERGEFEEAEQQLRQAVALNDRHAEALYFLARALAGRKNLGEASDLMKRAVEIEPENGEYWYHLGLIYERGQQVRDAIDSFTKAIDKGNRSADAYEHLGLNLMVENRFQEAVKALTKASEADPKRARIWAEVGDAQQQAGDLDGAIRDFQRALSQDPSLPSVWTKLGIAYKDKDCKGCRTKAVDAFQRGIRVDPADALAHHQLGYMFKDDGRRREAIAEFRRYLDLRPDAGDASNVQDDIYYLQEESRRIP
ncbi:MAG TPA: tetratricopeptide repeat protein [Myxococcales bacterium]|nr:tetratricopeptide repeat protein [Myxococcales bacterium]